MLLSLVVWLRTKEISNKQLIRFIGACICFSSTSILLLMKDSVKTTFNFGITELNNMLGISINQLSIGLMLLIIALLFIRVLRK